MANPPSKPFNNSTPSDWIENPPFAPAIEKAIDALHAANEEIRRRLDAINTKWYGGMLVLTSYGPKPTETTLSVYNHFCDHSHTVNFDLGRPSELYGA